MVIDETCPICGCKTSLPFYQYGAPGRQPVPNRICSDCGLVFLERKNNNNELKEYYENYIVNTQPGLADIPFKFEEHILAIARMRLAYLKPFLKDGNKILDVGCSFGAMLHVLEQESGLNLTLTGVNPEASFALFGKKRYGLDIRIGMFEDQNFADGSFDFIITDFVLEHMSNPRLSLSKFHEILAENGRLFIATNNIEEFHGFLWQNFFPDHRFSFSSKTLKTTLESEGFRILNQNVEGHDTFEGYHYPYQYCVAEKAAKPEIYDFVTNGDNADERVRAIQVYQDRFFSQDKNSKMLFELNQIVNPSEETKGHMERLKNASRENSERPYHPKNHTLPAQGFFPKRVVIADCKSGRDVTLARRLVSHLGLNPHLIVLRREPEGNFSISQTQNFPLPEPSPRFNRITEVWKWLEHQLPSFDVGFHLKLDQADLPEHILLKTYLQWEKRKKDYAAVDFRQFTHAFWEVFIPECLKDQPETSLVFQDHTYPIFEEDGNVRSNCMLIWPDMEDSRYYFVEKFQNFFGHPRGLSFDLSPACNFKCSKCQFHAPGSMYSSALTRNRIMPKELAFRILDEASRLNPRPTIATTFSGEPLMYPYLNEFLAHSRDVGLKVALTTNGQFMTEEVSKQLLDLEVSSILISLDAINEPTYNLLQAGGDFATVQMNIHRLMELRGKKSDPVIGIHYTINKQNQPEFRAFLEYWQDKVDFVSNGIEQNQFVDSKPVLPLYHPAGPRIACWAAWSQMYIRWNGDLSLCGFDIEGKMLKVSLNKHSLMEAWNSPEFWEYRNYLLDLEASRSFCRKCICWASRSVNYNNAEYAVLQGTQTRRYIFNPTQTV